MTMMLRAMGIDPEGIKRDVQQFMDTVKTGVEKINANQARIESQLDRIEKLLDPPGETVSVNKPNGEATGVLLTTERFPAPLLAAGEE
jgi:hypothetical protein